MENVLIALDGTPGSLAAVRYVARMLAGHAEFVFWLLHVLPTASPNLLKKEEIERIEKIQEESLHLAGYFWSSQDEQKMLDTFEEARQILLDASFAAHQIRTHVGVEAAEVAQVILERAEALDCRTVVLGRRGLSRVKEFFLGSVSKSVVGHARGRTVWVVDS